MKTITNHSMKFLIALLILLNVGQLVAQELKNGRIEKIYAQTDRSFYFPGETIWFKSYIVEGDHTITGLSDVLYAELISPKGIVVKTLNLEVRQGAAYGDFMVSEDWVGGIYKLKMYTQWMQNYGEEGYFSKDITIQKIVKPQLLMSLEFEDKGYGKGAEVQANLKLKDLKNQPLAQTEFNYKVTVQGEEILNGSQIADKAGKAEITFKLPNDLTTRDVVLNVLVPHNGLTESISKSVPVVLDIVDLQFLPEGGKLIQGIEGRVAFKAIDEFGKPVDVSGVVKDASGKEITTFRSFHEGIGAFNVLPLGGNTYYAELKTPFVSKTPIPLPTVHAEGVSLQTHVEKNSLDIRIDATNNKPLNLRLISAGNVWYNKSVASKNTRVQLNTEEFPMGIALIQLCEHNGEPLAERLVFLNPDKQLNVALEMEKETYQTREKVSLKVRTTDVDGKPIPSNLSVAVVDNKLVSFANDKQDHIISSLLMSSELKGKIHRPKFYFDPEEETRVQALDLVMLTHGWRDYVKMPLSIGEATYKPEWLTIQRGVVLDVETDTPVQANLLLLDRHGEKITKFPTRPDGSFAFKFGKNNFLTLIAYSDSNRVLKIVDGKQIRHERKKKEVSNDNPFDSEKKPNNVSKFDKPGKKVIKKTGTATSVSLTEDVSQLDEVVVAAGYGVFRKKQVVGAVSSVQSEEITSNTDIARLLAGRVSGVQITNASGVSGNVSQVVIRGYNSITGNHQPLLIVDGIPVDEESMSLMNPSEIESVSVLKGIAATTIYGAAGGNGVIVINTKLQSPTYSRWHKYITDNKRLKYAYKYYTNSHQLNFYQSRAFYMPKYQSTELPQEREDFRQTIYWNPVVQTNAKGEAEIEFYNSDAISSFQIEAEGIGYNGLVGRQTKLYATKKLLHVDVKVPNYMVIDDKISLQVRVNNGTARVQEVRLEAELPEQLKALKAFANTITVPANSSVVVPLDISPMAVGKDVVFKIHASTDVFKDVLETKTTILSPYFPTRVSISGSQGQSYKMPVKNMVNGSARVGFKLYTDVVGDVMDGIEGLIREPHGCFEQVSSSTYPNILVLKYLREAQRSNSVIEAKAGRFIEKGYHKLVSYETSNGGFEWFGNTPPHETLTAYGVLEFTEMKAVYDGVDQKMIDRTVKWLMSRRDGKGGFKRSNKGYDSFASSENNVANAYIVYAISESGVKVDISAEYQKAYKEALRSLDVYRMGLMVLASYNLGETQNAKLLMQRIKEALELHNYTNLPVESTITQSYGNAKQIETAAFTVLALLKEEVQNEMAIAEGIEFILSQRKYGRFGSTQSTAMALKALIGYAKTQNEKLIAQNAKVVVSINGDQQTEAIGPSDNGKLSINGFEDVVKEGHQEVEIAFVNTEDSYPYALDLEYYSYLPESSEACPLELETEIKTESYAVGDNVSMAIHVTNKNPESLGMVTAVIGIPSGTAAQPWQLKELLEQHQVAYYEVFDNYLVFYWRSMNAEETKKIRLDLKAEVPGEYQAPASTVYLYYGDEHKVWKLGTKVKID